MATILQPESDSSLNTSTGTRSASSTLKDNFIACRLQFKFLGVSKTLTADQKRLAAQSFRCRWGFYLCRQAIDQHQARRVESVDLDPVASNEVLEGR